MRTSILTSFAIAAMAAVACPVSRASEPAHSPILETPAASDARPRIAVGDAAPGFRLSDETGATVTFPSATNRPTVLVFYRGSWCPFCARQLADLRGLRGSDDTFDLYAISIDPAAKSAVLADRIGRDGKGALGFRLLSDPDHATIDAYGLHDERYDGSEFAGIPRPTVVVVGTDGRVAWARISEDYKVRPSNDEIRAAIQAATRRAIERARYRCRALTTRPSAAWS